MQKGFAGIYLIVGILILGAIGGAYFLGNKATSNFQSNSQSPKVTPASIPQPSPVDETTNWKVYTNNVSNYSFKYPEDWDIKEDIHYNYSLPVVYVFPKFKPCPSGVNPFTCESSQAILISVADNPGDLSIEDYVKRINYEGDIKYKTIYISGLEAKRTTEIPSQDGEDSTFIKKDHKIYIITWVKANFAKHIKDNDFENFLSTFKFLDQQNQLTCTSNSICASGFSCWYKVPKGPAAGVRGTKENPGQCLEDRVVNQMQ